MPALTFSIAFGAAMMSMATRSTGACAAPRAHAPASLASKKRFAATAPRRASMDRRRAVAEPSAADDAGASPSAPPSAPPASSSVARSLEFMVEMACGKCVSRVEAACASVPGVDAVVATLSTNTVRVVARDANADAVSAAVENAGYKCRLIGQGDIGAFGEDLAARLGTDLRTLHQSLAAVSEFKGRVYGHGDVTGVVRLVQVDERVALIEGSLAGLAPGAHTLVIHEYGDTTRGVDSVGPAWPGASDDPASSNPDDPAGRVGDVVADEEGRAVISSRVLGERVKVWDVIGRSLGVHPNGDETAGAAAVLARSAGVGENLKRVCQCDGTVIWESSPDDFTPQVVADGNKTQGPLGGKGKVSIRRG